MTRTYLFGIGSPEWQERTGHTVNARGVPIPTRRCTSRWSAQVRCELRAGHVERHGHSFFARYWATEDRP